MAAGGLPDPGGGLSAAPGPAAPGPRRRLLAWFTRRPETEAWALLAPGTVWMLVFFAIPVVVMCGYSFMPRGTYGGVDPGFTLEAYARFLHPVYLKILERTFVVAIVCTALCALTGYPVAYAITRSGKWRTLLLFLVVLPFWTSFLVRTFAMIFLMRDTGLINTWLLRLGIIHQPLTMLYTPFAVLLGLVYGYLPYMILPIYASLEKLDPSLLEAAEVLGARPAARFRRVTLPLSAPGLIAGSLLVFIPALGSFLTSDLLGGAKGLLVGNLVQNQFSTARNWPFGSAASLILMTLVLIAVLIYLRLRPAGADGRRGGVLS